MRQSLAVNLKIKKKKMSRSDAIFSTSKVWSDQLCLVPMMKQMYIYKHDTSLYRNKIMSCYRLMKSWLFFESERRLQLSSNEYKVFTSKFSKIGCDGKHHNSTQALTDTGLEKKTLKQRLWPAPSMDYSTLSRHTWLQISKKFLERNFYELWVLGQEF